MRSSIRFAFAALLALASLCAHGANPAPAAANGLDAAAKARLVGEHLLTLQWIGWGDLSGAGTLVV